MIKTWTILGIVVASAATAVMWQRSHRAPIQPILVDVVQNAGAPIPEETAVRHRTYRLLVVASYRGRHLEETDRHRRAYLSSQGYVPGENLTIIHDVGDNDVRQLKAILKKRLADGADVVCVDGTTAATAAGTFLDDFPSLPFVFSNVTDPVGLGLIDGFSSPPQRNITGVSYPVAVRDRLMFVREVFPKARRLGMIFGNLPSSRCYRQWLESLLANDSAFAEVHFVFKDVPVATQAELDTLGGGVVESAIRELDGQVDVFVSANDDLGVRQSFAEAVWRLASKPLVGLGRADVMEGWGASASIFPSYAAVGRQSGAMVAALFSGTPITELRAEHPKEIGTAFDLDRLKRFGVTVKPELIEAAGENVISHDAAAGESR